MNKYGKRIVLIFYMHCIKCKEGYISFLHLFFKQVSFEKNLFKCIAVFLQSAVLYANIPFKS